MIVDGKMQNIVNKWKCHYCSQRSLLKSQRFDPKVFVRQDLKKEEENAKH